jgi:hypothetical protein
MSPAFLRAGRSRRAQRGGAGLGEEWKRARKFGDKFWLYVVTEAAGDAPQLQRIQDSAARFAVGEDIFATGVDHPR